MTGVQTCALPIWRILLENARRVSFGLQPGSGDLIGWKTIAGRAIFLSAEVKTDTGRMSHEQVNWLDFVRKSGGIAEVFRSADEVAQLNLTDYQHLA